MLLTSIFGKSGENFLDMGTGEGIEKKFKEFFSGLFPYNNVVNPLKGIIDFLWGLGLLVVFVSTIVLGIKYMLVNPNEKSRVKQATTPYIIGVIIIFGAVTIWKLIIDVLEGSMLGG